MANRIHISEKTQELLSDKYKVEPRNDEGLSMKVGKTCRPDFALFVVVFNISSLILPRVCQCVGVSGKSTWGKTVLIHDSLYMSLKFT